MPGTGSGPGSTPSVAEGYMRQTHRDILLIDADPDALLDRLEAYDPPEIPKWITGAGDT
jgi:hypothetical protein